MAFYEHVFQEILWKTLCRGTLVSCCVYCVVSYGLARDER